MNRNTDLSRDAEKLLHVKSNDVDVILKEHKVTQKQLQDIVDLIKDWYDKQPHLPKNRLEDRIIVQLLISSKFRIEKVKDKIDAAISAKRKMPEFLLNRDPLSPNINEYLIDGFFAILPKLSQDNHRVSIFRLKSPRELVITDAIKLAFMMLEYRRYNDVHFGDQYIHDLSNIRFSNTVQMTPPIITKMMYYLRFCSGAKIKGIHFINMPGFVTPIVSLVKKLLKPKIAARIYIHSKPEDIAKMYPRNILPKEYGGDDFSIEEIAENWKTTLQSEAWRQYYRDQEKVVSDESKRTRILSCDEFFGCEGSFRKLEFD